MKIKLELEIETVKDFDLDTVNIIGRIIKNELQQYKVVSCEPTLTILDKREEE